jgi:glutathione S-transferase
LGNSGIEEENRDKKEYTFYKEEMLMKLYYSPGACSLATHIVLNESGLDYIAEPVDLKAGRYVGGDFKKVNPKGYVPVLELDDGEFLTEAAVICQYVADQAPEMRLIAEAGSMDRYRQLEMMHFISTELHKGFGPLWGGDANEQFKSATKDKLGQRFAYINEQLGKKPYLFGDRFTIADAYLYVMLTWTGFHQINLSSLNNLTEYKARVEARPCVQTALKTEGLLK